jgi:hypothetical protein
MKLRSALILIATHVTTLLAGAWLGFQLIGRLTHFGALEELAQSQALASASFAEGANNDAREALVRNLELLDRRGPSALQPTELAVDRAITLLRLWKVEVAAGRAQQATDYRARAQRVCEEAKWKDCSDQAMDRLISWR